MGDHECKMYYFCFDRLSCCRVSCDKAKTTEQGGLGTVAPKNYLLQEIVVIGKTGLVME